MKASKIFAITIVVLTLLTACSQTPTTATTTPTSTATTTPTPTATTAPTPKAIRGTANLPAPSNDWTPIDECWEKAAIELWGVGDIAERTFSYMDDAVYKDKDGIFFTLYHFRVYIYDGQYWNRTALFPMFGNRIVIGQSRVLVLDEDSVEAWEIDYVSDGGYWDAYRRFAVIPTTSDIRVFGDYVDEDSESKAYIASAKNNEIWTISMRGIETRSYDSVLLSNEAIFVAQGAMLNRVAYKPEPNFTSTSKRLFDTLNESMLEGVNTLLNLGSVIDPIEIRGGTARVKEGQVYVQEDIARIIID